LVAPPAMRMTLGVDRAAWLDSSCTVVPSAGAGLVSVIAMVTSDPPLTVWLENAMLDNVVATTRSP
jgi:hypothetical protein